MNISLNGRQTGTWNMVMLTGVPNILTVSGSSETGTRATANVGFVTLTDITAGKEYTVTVNGHPLKSVPSPSEAVGTRFYLPTQDSFRNRVAATMSLMRALQNIPEITADYSLSMYRDLNADAYSPTFTMTAYGYSQKYNISVSHDLPQTCINWSIDAGNSTSELAGGNNNVVTVDIYRYPHPARMGESPVASQAEFVTSLSRRVSTDTAEFDLSPVLEATTEYGSVSEYRFSVYLTRDGFMDGEDTIDGVYATKGYMVNQGMTYIPKRTSCMLAQNLSRGTSDGYVNATLPYVYWPSLPVSLYTPSAAGQQVSLEVKFLDSAKKKISSQFFSVWPSDKTLTHSVLSLSDTEFAKASYVTLVVPDDGEYIWKVLRPVRMADERRARRVLWYNEYGGISFADFTGNYTEQRKVKNEYYEQTPYGYHTDTRRRRDNLYSKDVTVTVSHETHNMGLDSTWLYYSLQNSREAWVTVGGVEYTVNVSDIKITESTSNAGVYRVQATYQYSLADTV